MSLAVQVLFTGLSAGGVYGLIAIGHSLIYRLTGIVHFALGDLIGLGAFVTLLVATGMHPLALATQFQEFLANPDPGGGSRTSYRYELVRRAQPGAAVAARGERRDWAVPLAVGLGLAVAANGVVLWAHS